MTDIGSTYSALAVMKTITLNIQHGGGRRIPRLIAFLKAHDPDAIVLTEFRENDNARTMRDVLASQGLPHFAAASTSSEGEHSRYFRKTEIHA